MKSFFLLFFAVSLIACSHGNCRDRQAKAETTTAVETTPPLESQVKTSQADHVKVYKADGSLQCNRGQALTPAAMQSQLGDIHVYSSANKNDGLMHAQVCGSATGRVNVYEIDRKNLSSVLKKGFKEWIND